MRRDSTAVVTLIRGAILALALVTTGVAHSAESRGAPPPAGALVALTGRETSISDASYRLARSQEIFDEIWVAHAGEGVQRAAQGWPMTPQIDFSACDAIFAFGGPRVNTNGYRVVDRIEVSDAVTVRFESISYQTASFDGEDHGEPARPWALFVVPRTQKTIFLEQNTQARIGGPPVWTRRAAFPGLIGIGRPVGGTRQSGS